MLSCLRVRNLVLIDQLEIEFEPGLNVITGETGAGKSMLIKALSLVFGEKGRPDWVRSGAEQAEVEALFDVAGDASVARTLEGAEIESGPELVVRRVVRKNGRSRAYVNGRLVTASFLATLVAGLVDISSQHEHHTLVDPSSHLAYLDAFGGLDDARRAFAESFSAYRKAAQAHSAGREAVDGRHEREDLLRFQIRQIEELEPEVGEDVELAAERSRLRHAERLASVTGSAEQALYSRDNALYEELSRHAESLRGVAEIDPTLSPIADVLDAAASQVEEAARELSRYAQSAQVDPERLLAVDERLHRLSAMTRRHGGDLEGVFRYLEEAKAELSALDDKEEALEALEAERDEAHRVAAELARTLSEKRKASAQHLAEEVTRELGSLGMGEARVEVKVDVHQARGDDGLSVDGARLTDAGIDRVELLIAPNRGEPARALRKIASGGELSRAMLAIKRALAGLGRANLYVFDEVDTGVGGAVAEVIGQKLADVARHHQVICVTHLAQIAVYGDRHFRVDKRAVDERTRSEIHALDQDQRVEEVARMVGGLRITARTRETAAELLRQALRAGQPPRGSGKPKKRGAAASARRA